MTTDEKITVCSFKVEEQAKRRFAAAMRAQGTTVSERIRKAVHEYLDDLDKGVEHPQFRLELDAKTQVVGNSR